MHFEVEFISKNNSFEISNSHRVKLDETNVLIKQLGAWRCLLDDLASLHIVNGAPTELHKALDITLTHLSISICNTLQVHGRVLIPVDISVIAPAYENATMGHGAVLFIEHFEDTGRARASFFETSGKLGGNHAIDDINKYCKDVAKNPFDDHFSREELSHIDNRSRLFGAPDFYVRFSRWMAEGPLINKLEPKDIKSILTQMTVIRDPLSRYEELNEKVSVLQQEQIANIFSVMKKIGDVRIVPQPLSFAQLKGECEHESLMSFCNYYVGELDKKLSSNLRISLHDMGIEMAEEQMEKVEKEILGLEYKINSPSHEFRIKTGVQIASRSNTGLISRDEGRILKDRLDIEKNKLLSLRESKESLEKWNKIIAD